MRKLFSECIKTELIVSCYQNRAVFCGGACCVETGSDFVIIADKTCPGANCTKEISLRESCCNSGYRTGCSFYKTCNKRTDDITCAFKPTGPRGRLGTSTGLLCSSRRHLERSGITGFVRIRGPDGENLLLRLSTHLSPPGGQMV